MLPSLQSSKRAYPEASAVAQSYSLDSFRGTPRFWQRRWLIFGPVVVCIIWLGIECLLGDWRIFQSGSLTSRHHPPVYATHARFNDSCTQCHESHFQTWKRLNPCKASQATVADDSCTQCHRSEVSPGESLYPRTQVNLTALLEGRPAPPHHAEKAEPQACAVCHREHRGNKSLTAVEDAACNTCHSRLDRVVTKGTAFGNARDFASDHPEFDALGGPDPGRLAFNHAVHLKPEGVPIEGSGSRRRLDCADCHKPEPAGRLMAPIRYEKHCRDCHPLRVALAGDFSKSSVREGVEQFLRRPAPHRPPEVVRADLRQQLEDFVRDNPGARETPLAPQPLIPLPGRPARVAQTPTAEEWKQAQLAVSERLLFFAPGGCHYCHSSDWKGKVEPAGTGALPRFDETGLKARWMRHSAFNHSALRHSKMDCLDCHKAGQSQKTHDVLLPKVADCRVCHSPQGEANTHTSCITCHRYHVPAPADPQRTRQRQAAQR